MRKKTKERRKESDIKPTSRTFYRCNRTRDKKENGNEQNFRLVPFSDRKEIQHEKEDERKKEGKGHKTYRVEPFNDMIEPEIRKKRK